jgi:hypothetical protein
MLFPLAPLTVETLKSEVQTFVRAFNDKPIPILYGTTDGKKVGTHIEQELNRHLVDKYAFKQGNSASGIDFPELNVDLKTTSISQPQSSCPFRDASQKIFGLGYHLIVLTYNKTDDDALRAARLTFQHAIFVNRERTADYQTTAGILNILARNGNEDDIDGFLEERMLPADDVSRRTLAKRIVMTPPKQGYLTISNALQWRLQYTRVNDLAAQRTTDGVENLLE